MVSPSSSPSDPFAFLVGRGAVAELTTSGAWVATLAEVEAAVAAAQAEAGDIPAAAAAVVATLAASIDDDDVATIVDRAALGGNLVIPLVDLLRERAGTQAPHVHRGATSQDIADTAAMLVAKRCLGATAASLDEALLAVTELEQFAGTPVIARTLLQWAEPTTFGATLARWRDGLATARAAAATAAADLPLQLGGPVGDGASFGEHYGTIAAGVARRLDLHRPDRAWHSQRSPIVALAGTLATVSTAAATVATDIVHLAASDAGEVVEHAKGAGQSSSMAHKRNPVAAVCARAAAAQAPGLVATLLAAAGSHELERAAGPWHAEWPALNQLLRCTGSAVDWIATSLQRVVPDTGRMAANLADSNVARR